ncbi:hypothetical protein E4V01_00465 [Methylorubrum sp. Q1]|uniref:hypothetical protein n=1 Tax=Methylorubrum sp. Q1 TaxID=2562453 RepID=UPI0010765E55|nr:hypothetical protein [Methylorubrum sp. Q1]TFZ61121.1 hypothetical protein E4V01_00465 [Methylorubrum sp. Q1]
MARKQTLPKTRRDAGSTVSPAALNAMTPPDLTRSLGDTLSAITGAVLIDLLMGQGKTLDEASVLTGIPRSRLYADGISFATAFMAKLDPIFGAAMSATPEENARMEADVLAQIAANGPDAQYVPGAH